MIPNTYKRIEYLESTGTQWIDAGLPLDQDSKLEMLLSHFDTNGNRKTFGSRSSATQNNFSVVSGPVSGIMSIVADFCDYKSNRLAYAIDGDEFLEISISKEMLKINDSEKVVSTYSNFTTPDNAYLFNCSGTYPSGYTSATMRMHYCKIYDNGILVRDFTPCYRKSDGEIGLYDLVNDVFYTNAGTGTFIAGPVIEEPVATQISTTKSVDWTESMQQTFEYYTVDPGTWKDVKRLNNVKSCTINRDLDTDTLGSATIDVTESLGESYIRVYLIVIQNGVKERFPLGTYLVQTPASSYNGMVRDVSMDAYTPLIELKENSPPIGYYTPKNENVMVNAIDIIRDNMRAPVVNVINAKTLSGNFVANTDDTWFSYVKDLISIAEYEFTLDELGRVLFSPIQDIETLQPVWTYDDMNSSILYPEFSMKHDLYDIPNVVEVIYTNDRNTFYSRVENTDPNSPTSIQNRGRIKKHRVSNPSFEGEPTQQMVNEYAEKLLKTLSTVEYSVSYSHAYCPVRLGDCIRLNYSRAGVTGIKAKVISQSIKCEPGCPVSEKAIFTTKLWR